MREGGGKYIWRGYIYIVRKIEIEIERERNGVRRQNDNRTQSNFEKTWLREIILRVITGNGPVG